MASNLIIVLLDNEMVTQGGEIFFIWRLVSHALMYASLTMCETVEVGRRRFTQSVGRRRMLSKARLVFSRRRVYWLLEVTSHTGISNGLYYVF